ncbi:hypothetical protein B0T11DRAFT_10810 [Plectosphaerella cucumerina]|uniref:Heterokaryon incompatibility domain-containing protein n=1 Tax=Plectosphaerella cucumerina TaxID=40658 RepID=A0A8K0TNL9_9PEZI|nr:hypothetical protein B0T11DRAFT_10810 [Plectosphaerella cucumerina]
MAETRTGVDTLKGVDALGDGAIPLDMASDAAGKHTPQPESQISPIEYKILGEDEIRLIKLLPGDRDEPLACQLERQQPPTCPPYDALSYAWGDMTTADPVIVGGQAHRVGNSLFSALRRLQTLPLLVAQLRLIPRSSPRSDLRLDRLVESQSDRRERKRDPDPSHGSDLRPGRPRHRLARRQRR